MRRVLRSVPAIVLLSVMSVSIASGRQGDEGDALLARAEQALAKQDYPSSRSLATAALARFEETQDQRGLGRVRMVLGRVATLLGEYPAATAEYTQAVQAFEAADYPRGRAMARLGLVMTNGGFIQQNRPEYELALADARLAGDPVVEARILHSAGDGSFAVGEYAVAFDYYDAAAPLFERAGQLDALGTVHNSLGRLYRAHGRADAALSEERRALALHEKQPGSFFHLQSLNAVAMTYQSLGNLPASRRYFTEALAIAEKAASPRILDTVRANALDVMIAEDDVAAAALMLEGVIARGLDQFPSLRYRQLAGIYLSMGRTADALQSAEKAIAACVVPDGVDCVRAHDQRAAIHSAMGSRDAALADTVRALELLESVRRRLVPSDYFKQHFTEAEQGVYSRAIALQMNAGRPADALGMSELARARAFGDLLASRDIRLHDTPAAPVPSLRLRGGPAPATPPVGERRADDLESFVALPASSTADLVDAARRLNSTLLSYWVAEDALFVWVVKEDGRIQGTKVAVRRPRLASLVEATARVLPDRPGGSTSSGSLTTRGAQPIGLQVGRPAAWRELYDLLIRPIRSALPQSPGALLTVVPHGPLAALSFGGLLDGGRYLIEDFTLHYVPAAALLQFTARRRHPDARAGRLLLVADPALTTRSKLDQALPALPGARAEARDVAALLPAARVSLLDGRDATERRVTAATKDKAILHFATHAIVRDDDPLSSYLALGTDLDDGLLTAKEIYRLQIEADLVVLSACRAAAGRVTGDGIAAFARGFIYAGVSTVVASIWDLPDEPTNRLLPQFYRAWFSGASKARALRAAQLALLRQLRAGQVRIATAVGPVVLPEHPMFWAGFVVLGEPD